MRTALIAAALIAAPVAAQEPPAPAPRHETPSAPTQALDATPPDELVERRAVLQQRLEALRTYYGPRHPDVIATHRALLHIETALADWARRPEQNGAAPPTAE